MCRPGARRSSRDLVGLLDDVADAGIVFRSATEPLDTSTPATILVAEAATVRLIFDNYSRDRLGTNAIATLLNDSGLRTRTGKPWSQHTVGLILTNRVCLGEKHFRDIAVIDVHEPIIARNGSTKPGHPYRPPRGMNRQRAANPSDYTLTGNSDAHNAAAVSSALPRMAGNSRPRWVWTRSFWSTAAPTSCHDIREPTDGHLPHGGPRRSALGYALIPLVVLADEPTGNLDSAATLVVLRLLESSRTTGLTLVIATHDERVAATADRLISMRDGAFVDQTRLVGGTRDTLADLTGMGG